MSPAQYRDANAHLLFSSFSLQHLAGYRCPQHQTVDAAAPAADSVEQITLTQVRIHSLHPPSSEF